MTRGAVCAARLMSGEADLSAEALRDIDHTPGNLNFRGTACLPQQNAFRHVKMPRVFIVGQVLFSWACG